MSLPIPFIDSTRALLGDEEYTRLFAALLQAPPVSIRLNEAKPFSSRLPLVSGVLWSDNGFYLDERLTFTFDPLFHAGCYYVQEASSMFVGQALRQYLTQDPLVALDLCAAPGGKSTHVRSLLPEGSLLIANEVIRNRSQILAENLTKWGHPGVVVTNNDPSEFAPLEGFFDVILTDVPCSGEGMFRKDAGAIHEWSPANVDVCQQRQRRILSAIWPCLRPGGLLIYSTCTYNTKEDEENVQWMQQELEADVLPVAVSPDWNIVGTLLPGTTFPVYRFLPHRTQGEGFFLAVLRKPISSQVAEPFQSNSRKKTSALGKGKTTSMPVSKEQLATAQSWLCAPETFDLSVTETVITAFPKAYADRLSTLQSALRVVQAGVTLAEVRGKDLLPAHALAVSTALRPAAFPTTEVTYEQAIAYLRKEAISLSDASPRGYVLLTYRNIPLGFVKNIGNRANNLYPQAWRIRSGYLPEELKYL